MESAIYGYQVMDSHESPRHPFEFSDQDFISLQNSSSACKLNQYCLNREPAYFSHTQLALDQFHWKGNVGCSSGYNLNTYKTSIASTINSQVNEQANAGLQHIKSQLAHMSHENFMHMISLFLAIKNLDALKKLR